MKRHTPTLLQCHRIYLSTYTYECTVPNCNVDFFRYSAIIIIDVDQNLLFVIRNPNNAL